MRWRRRQQDREEITGASRSRPHRHEMRSAASSCTGPGALAADAGLGSGEHRCGCRDAADRRHRHPNRKHPLRRLCRRGHGGDALRDQQEVRSGSAQSVGARRMRLGGWALVRSWLQRPRHALRSVRCPDRSGAAAARLRQSLAPWPLPLSLEPPGSRLRQQQRPRPLSQPRAAARLLGLAARHALRMPRQESTCARGSDRVGAVRAPAA